VFASLASGPGVKPGLRCFARVEDDPEGFSYWKIKHGIRWTGMPSWKGDAHRPTDLDPSLFLKHMDKLPPAAEQAWQNVVN
jgi:thiosulfate dehydrogenase